MNMNPKDPTENGCHDPQPETVVNASEEKKLSKQSAETQFGLYPTAETPGYKSFKQWRQSKGHRYENVAYSEPNAGFDLANQKEENPPNEALESVELSTPELNDKLVSKGTKLRKQVDSYEKMGAPLERYSLEEKSVVRHETSTLPKRQYKKCHRHDHEDVVFFCLQCDHQICQRCLVPQHLHHDVKNLEDVIVLFRKQISVKLEAALQYVGKWKQDLLNLKDTETTFQISLDEEYSKVDECVTGYCDSVRREEKRLEGKLDTAAQRLNDDFATDKLYLQNHIKSFQSQVQSVATPTVESMANHLVITKQRATLSELTQKCQDSKTFRSKQDRKMYSTIKFEEQCPESPLEVGRVVEPLNVELHHQFDDGVTLATTIAPAANGGFLVGDVEGQEAMIYRKVNEVYNQHALAFSTPPLGIAVTKDGEFLISTHECIMRFSSSGDLLSNFTTFSSKSQKVGPLSSSNGRIFGGHVTIPFITEFDDNGSPERTIYTKNIVRSFSLVNASQMAVCYQDIPGVDVINFEKQMANELSVLCHIDIPVPLSIFFARDSQCLIIGSYDKSHRQSQKSTDSYQGSGVIAQYCITTGKMVECLVDGLHSPLGMAITTEGILAVADGRSVKLYFVK